jgi:hypothetical protein
VVNLLEDPERRAGMGQAGQILVQDRFSMHSWARRLRDIYTEATAGERARELGTSSP